MKFIDWEAYKKGLQQLKNANEAEPKTAPPQPKPTATAMPNDEGAELLKQQTHQAEQTARKFAAGNIGIHLGDVQGRGDAPVADYEPQPMFASFQKHAQLQRQLGDRLSQNYRQRLTLQSQADKQAAELEGRRQLQQERADLQLKQQQHRQLFDAAVQQEPEAQKQNTQPATKTQSKSTTVRKTYNTGRGRSAEQPFRIADTDGQTLKGYWNLTPDEAAQILQTAIDLGDQAQLDYVAQLSGADSANRQTTTAQVLSLRQKALNGNASARQRMAQLLSAIIPSLKGKKVVDGILNARYEVIGKR